MKKATKPIGLDANFREVFPGDEVRDADGHGYTITAAGWAKPLTGGSEIAFKRLKDPIVVCQAPRVQEGDHTQSAKFAEGPDGKVGPASRLMAAPVIPGPTPHTRNAQPIHRSVTAAVKAKEPKPSRVGIGGKKNNSGWSKLTAICRTLGISGQGLTGYLRDHGFEVYRAEGTSCVKVEDREKVVAFLRQNPPPAGLPKTSSYDGAVRRIRKDVEAGKERKEGPAIVTTDPAKVFTKFDAFLILEDADMVAELRHRGWTVTCVKHTEL